MSKTVKVTYNSETLMTEITVDGQSFDTSRINGKEIADWAYPFMMRKIKWNGFYDEMVEALGGEKSFDLIFDGSEDDLNELKEAWEDAPVNIISEECSGNNVVIEYDEDTLSTNITVNGVPFDTSRINGKEIDDWVYPFMMRKVKWDGIFEELANVTGSEEYTIEFSGSNSAMKVLMEECPEDVEIMRRKNTHNKKTANKKSCASKSQNGLSEKHSEHKEKAKVKFCAKYGNKWNDNGKHLTGEENAQSFYVRGLWYRDIIKNYRKAERLFRLSYALDVSLGNPNPRAENDMDLSDDSKFELANTFYYGSICCSPDYYKALEYYKQIEDSLDECGKSHMAGCYEKIADGLCWEENYTLSISKYLESIRLLEYVMNYYSDEINDAEDDDWIEFYTIQLNYVKDDIGRCYYRIAQCYSNIEDYKKSVEWYTKAAEYGNAYAQNALGDCYYFGRGVEQNYEKAVEWYTEVAEQGYSDAQYKLGCCYYWGDGVSQNYEKAVEWYTEAAEQGIVNAQNTLGMCYQYGKGVTENSAKAVELYEKSVEQNDGYACYLLGQCYRTGVGVNTDKNLALELFKKGAELGDKDAAQAYNDMIKNGNTLDFAKKVGLNFIKNSSGFLGNIGSAVYEAMQDNKNQSNDYE